MYICVYVYIYKYELSLPPSSHVILLHTNYKNLIYICFFTYFLNKIYLSIFSMFIIHPVR